MGIVDTHIHLYGEAFDDDRSDLIEKAKAEGVSHFFSARHRLDLHRSNESFAKSLSPRGFFDEWPTSYTCKRQL